MGLDTVKTAIWAMQGFEICIPNEDAVETLSTPPGEITKGKITNKLPDELAN